MLNLLFKQRRRHSWAEKIGIEWMDGMPLTMQQISTFYNDEHLQEMLDDLVEKNYLVLEHPKKKVYHTENGSTYTERVPDETLPKQGGRIKMRSPPKVLTGNFRPSQLSFFLS